MNIFTVPVLTVGHYKSSDIPSCESTISAETPTNRQHDALHPQPLPLKQTLLPAIHLYPRAPQPSRTPPLRARSAPSEIGKGHRQLDANAAQTPRSLQQSRQRIPLTSQARVRRPGVYNSQPPEMLLRRVCCQAQGPRDRFSAEELPGVADGAAGRGGCAEAEGAQGESGGDGSVSTRYEAYFVVLD
jgi:hypothetical protein